MGQPLGQFPGSLLRADGRFPLQQNIAGVDARIGEHGGHAGDGLALPDRPLDGRRSPMPGQQGSMHVHRADLRHIQHFLRKNLPEGGGDAQVRRKAFQVVQSVLANFQGLKYGNVLRKGVFLHRGHLHLAAPALGFIRLGKDPGHFVAVFHQRAQNGNGKLRRSHKNNFHSPSSSSSPSTGSYSSSPSKISRSILST